MLLLPIALLSGLACGDAAQTPALDVGVATPSNLTDFTLPKSAAVRRVDQALRIALKTAQTTLYATNPHIAQIRLMKPRPSPSPVLGYVSAEPGDDPNFLVWLIDLDQGGYSMSACPAPPPGVDQTTCWQSPTAQIAISVMTGDVNMLGAPYPRDRGTPYAASIYLPQSAAISSREVAMAAGFKLVPGQDGNPPTILEVRLLSGAEWSGWLKQHGSYADVGEIDPLTPIWEMEFVDAALAQGCTSSNTAGCVHDHLYLSLNAMTGRSLGYLFPAAGVPANYTP
ncbi:MAG: hypothetical protein WBW04_19585 [Nitrolancea sp.]